MASFRYQPRLLTSVRCSVCSILGAAGVNGLGDTASTVPFADDGDALATTRIQARYRGNLDRQNLQRREETRQQQAPSAPPADVESRLRQLFTGIDADGNGTLSREELAAKLWADTDIEELMTDAGKSSHYVFEQLDADGDGSIDIDEFVKLCVPDLWDDDDEDEDEEEAATTRPPVDSYITAASYQYASRLQRTAIAGFLRTDREFAPASVSAPAAAAPAAVPAAAPAAAPAPAVVNTDVATSRKKTRGALLDGLKGGALEAAVSKMEDDEAAAEAEEVEQGRLAELEVPTPASTSVPDVAAFSAKYIQKILCQPAIVRTASKDSEVGAAPVVMEKGVSFSAKSQAEQMELVLPKNLTQREIEAPEVITPGGHVHVHTPDGNVDLDALLKRAGEAVVMGEEKLKEQESSLDVALGETPGASERRGKYFARRLVEQDFPIEKAERVALAAVAHEDALEKHPKWTAGHMDYNQFVLRPLSLPKSMQVVQSDAAVGLDSPKKSSKGMWKKIRGKHAKKVEPELGVHLQLFSTDMPSEDPAVRSAIVSLELFETSPLINAADSGSVCCKLYTINADGSGRKSAVALGPFGATLSPKSNEVVLVIEDVDYQNLEVIICTSDSDNATELARSWMPVANLLSSSVEGRIVDVWLPSLPPPPQLDVTVKSVPRPRDDRSSGEDVFDLRVTIHAGANLRIGNRTPNCCVKAQLKIDGGAIIEEVLLESVAQEPSAHPVFEESCDILDEQIAGILAQRREGTKVNIRFEVFSKSQSKEPDPSLCVFEWELAALCTELRTRRLLDPVASTAEFQRAVGCITRSQLVWREQVIDRIDAVSAFRAIDMNANGLLGSEEMKRVKYVMDGGADMTPKEVKAAEAEIETGKPSSTLLVQPYLRRPLVAGVLMWCAAFVVAVVRADGLTGLMHRNWRGQGEDQEGVDFDQFFAWISKKAT